MICDGPTSSHGLSLSLDILTLFSRRIMTRSVARPLVKGRCNVAVVVVNCVSAFYTTSQSSTTENDASLVNDVDSTVPQSQSTDEYLPLETDDDTATVAMETPRSTMRELIQHSITSVDMSTMPDHFTTGMTWRCCSELQQLCFVSYIVRITCFSSIKTSSLWREVLDVFVEDLPAVV